MSFTTSLQRQGDCALAQIFHPHAAPAAAAQVLIPHGLLDQLAPWDLRWSSTVEAVAPYHPVAEVIQARGRGAAYGLIYEAWEYAMLRGFRRLSAAWPPLLRAALSTAYGLDEPVDRAAHAAAAANAIAEARQALYGYTLRGGGRRSPALRRTTHD